MSLAIAKVAADRDTIIKPMIITYTTYERKDFPELLKVLPEEKLNQFLMSKAVSGGK